MTSAEILKILGGYQFATHTELHLQNAIEEIFKSSSVPYIREYRLSAAERLDFLCGTIAIETKISGSKSEVTRQLQRYLLDERITEIILVTNRSKHQRLPDRMNNKPLHILWIGGNSF